jgi:hypothetical protein
MLQLLGVYRTCSYLLSLIFLFVILDLSTCVYPGAQFHCNFSLVNFVLYVEYFA